MAKTNRKTIKNILTPSDIDISGDISTWVSEIKEIYHNHKYEYEYIQLEKNKRSDYRFYIIGIRLETDEEQKERLDFEKEQDEINDRREYRRLKKKFEKNGEA